MHSKLRTSVVAAAIVLAVVPAFAVAPRHGSLPAVSPDGRSIAFVSERDGGNSEVYLIGADGRGERRLTHSAADEYAPAWAADGRTVLYRFDRGDSTVLAAIDRDGTHARTLAVVPGRTPALAPDGRRIAWAEGSWTCNRIVVSALDGSERVALTDTTVAWYNLAWSPDGRHLAATRAASHQVQVWVMNAAGGDAHAVRIGAAGERPQWPAWSRDGKRLAFQVDAPVSGDPQRTLADIWVIDLASGRARDLTRHPNAVLNETPSWFPDGRRLAFQSDRTGSFEVWTMRSDGRDARPLTR